jgi:hypothetical protein
VAVNGQVGPFDVPIVLSVWTRNRQGPLMIALPSAASTLATDALCPVLSAVGITVIGVRYEGSPDPMGIGDTGNHPVIILEATGDPAYLLRPSDRVAACLASFLSDP